MQSNNIPIYTSKDFEGMRKAGSLAAKILDQLKSLIKPGISTLAINDFCHKLIVENEAIPAPLNYKGFPKSICTSVNHVVCHGIPNDKKILKDSDIINVDVTVILDGWYGDSSRMYVAGPINNKIYSLLKTTYECLLIGIENALPGKHLGDIGYAIQNHAEKNHYSVVEDYCGHGIGQVYHEEPQVLHYGKTGRGLEIKEGMCFTIEPMINQGSKYTKLLSDGWTVETKDGRNSAQWEHTLAVTASGVEVLTKRSEESF